MPDKGNILMSGASGFIGSALVSFLAETGYVIHRLVRSEPRHQLEIPWTPGAALEISSLPKDIRAIINLSGSPIAVPFTAANKRTILKSRLDCTQTLVQAVLRMPEAPPVFLNASGIGYYGNCADLLLTEASSPGTDYVADVCVQWEAALAPLHTTATRTMALRTGLVLEAGGGALAKMLPAFRLGAGAILGNGRQYMSWISLRDYLNAIKFLLEHDGLSGPVNFVSPNPVSNAEFSRCLAQALHRPLLARAPAFALKLAMGEMAELLLLASQRADPSVLAGAGFSWQDTELRPYLDGLFAR